MQKIEQLRNEMSGKSREEGNQFYIQLIRKMREAGRHPGCGRERRG
jgi:hypothetical protein